MTMTINVDCNYWGYYEAFLTAMRHYAQPHYDSFIPVTLHTKINFWLTTCDETSTYSSFFN